MSDKLLDLSIRHIYLLQLINEGVTERVKGLFVICNADQILVPTKPI